MSNSVIRNDELLTSSDISTYENENELKLPRPGIRQRSASFTAQTIPLVLNEYRREQEARVLDAQDFVANKMELLKATQISRKRVSLLAAFVPDFVLKDEGQKIPYQVTAEAVTLMADVSGFTALTEKYSLKGKGGTDQLTKTLSSYMGPLAECILRGGGDIIKYAGDAILAVWKVQNITHYPSIIQMVIDCALYIQEKHGSFDTDVGITIRVKLGVGAGEVYQCGIGNQEYHHFVCFGPGVQSASDAEKHCESGEVIVQDNAWNFLKSSQFNFSVKEAGFMKVKDIIAFENPEFRGRPMPSKVGFSHRIHQEEEIRANIVQLLETKNEGQLRHYVIPPVLKKMDDEIPLEYLNESRQISICFIKIDIVDFDKTVPFGNTMTNIVQAAFKHIYRMGTILQGCLTKIIMFDKGLTYLVVFGLPGYTHDNQSSNALKFSYRVKGQLNTIKYVTGVSLGVTSGATYCGVLGHAKRQEYTVIGRKVNKAARLMVYYPGKVTCDQDTLYHSKLPEEQFSLMEAKKLKGIENVGNIYEYLGAESGDDQSIRQFFYPMVGRDAELRYFETILNSAEQEFQRFILAHRLQVNEMDLKTTKEVVATGLWMLAFEGDNGIGKSRLLAACIQAAELEPCKVYSVTMSVLYATQRMYALKSLTTQCFGLAELRTPQEREEHLRKIVGDDLELAASLCLLNDFFRLKLPMHARYAASDLSSRHVYAQHVLSVLIRHFHPETLIIFVIDDAHLMDQNSWEYLQYLTRSPSVIALVSVRRNAAGAPRLPDEVTKILYHNRNVKSIRLSGLDPVNCLPLACQMMEVAAIPTELHKILMSKSKGVPAWIEQVLSEMLRTGLIKVVENDPSEYKKRNQKFTAVDFKFIQKIVATVKKKSYHTWNPDDLVRVGSGIEFDERDIQEQVTESIINSKRVQKAYTVPEKRACVVKSDTNIGATPIPGTLKEILLDAFDELNSNEQMLLKCASVLGLRFSRAMLIRLVPMYETNVKKYEFGFRRLMESRVIRCASKNTKAASEQTTTTTDQPECFCRFNRDDVVIYSSDISIPGKDEKKPKYYSCKFLEFAKDNMVEVIYELMTEDQRKEMHLKAAKYLDSSVAKCRICGAENPEFLYGITVKGGDLATDPEQALREDAAATKRKNYRKEIAKRRSTTSFTRSDPSVRRPTDAYQKKGSFATRIDGLKKIFQNGGTKLGDLEMDILKSLQEFDEQNILRKKRIGFLACCVGKAASDETKEWDLTISELARQADQDKQKKTILGDGDKADRTSNKTSSLSGHSRQSHLTNPDIDLRGCECASLQAKIAVEMVKHYRNSEKFGKCLHNLVDAAEASITIGNSAQALVHLEDAVGLLHAIETKELPAPAEDDDDDTGIEEDTVNTQIEFLNGLSYFELGVQHKALDFFCRSLLRLGIEVPSEEDKSARDSAISKASSKLWRRHSCTFLSGMCSSEAEDNEKRGNDEKITMKIRVLSYLHLLFRNERKAEMALLVSLWQVIFAEDISGSVLDVVPSYCSLMETYASMSDHKKALKYEGLALDLIKQNYGSKEQSSGTGLLTSANLFVTIASVRMLRGEIASATDAAYLALRIAQTLHDNMMTIHVFPMVIQSLLFSLRISEVIECLQKLWYISEEEEDWGGVAIYYTLCLDLLLNTAYPMEQFYTCEKFVSSSDWNAEIQLFREYEIQYNIEASLALWYCRYNRWEGAQKWITQAESHKPKLVTFLSVGAELKLLECELIFVNHYLETKRYQHFAKARNSAKALMRVVKKSTKVVPVFLPRFLHLMGYYCQIRSRNAEAENYLKKAEKIADEHGNNLELEWITHNRMVWADVAIPTLKFFWLEHTETHTLDWHQSGKVPWANIMYSLPLPTWK